MAEFRDVETVPYENPEQTELPVRLFANPLQGVWWTSQTASLVPENVMGWLVAQGWQIDGDIVRDNTTTPPTYYYNMTKAQLSPQKTLEDLCRSFTTATNDARYNNEQRYEDIREDWTELIESTDDYFKDQTRQHNSDLGVYVTDLNDFMDGIETLSDDNIETLTGELEEHESDTRGYLIGLGTTEDARIREDYAARLSVSVQDLIDRGIYNDIVYLDVRTRNHRDRDEQIQMLNDRLNREKVVNEHQLYSQQENLANHRHRRIVEKMNTSVAKLDGWKSVAADNRQLMAYQLDERNKLIIGLYSFVERRTDIAPEWKDMASMIAGLGDAAGGWITP